MNIITMYEQKYIDLETFIDEFPDSISESQEALYGSQCIEFYVDVTLGKTDYHYYVLAYGGDQCENDERLCFEDTCVEDEQDPFGVALSR
ncbi:hypothetical protein IGI73_002102 [Enterococcus sp. DIV0755f]